MIRTVIALVSALAFACGGYAAEDDTELGQSEQAVIALTGATRQPGAQTGGSRLSCNKTSSGQVCSIARAKSIEIARNPSAFSSAQNTVLGLVRAGLAGRYSDWTFTLVDSANPPGSGVVRIIVDKSTSGGGDNGNNVSNYRSNPARFSVNGMTNGQQSGLGSFVGQYQNHGACSTSIFTTRIDNKTSNTTQRLNLFRHAVGNAIAICMGLGTRNDTPGYVTQNTLNLGSALGFGSAGDACRMNWSEMNDLADISRQTASACPD